MPSIWVKPIHVGEQLPLSTVNRVALVIERKFAGENYVQARTALIVEQDPKEGRFFAIARLYRYTAGFTAWRRGALALLAGGGPVIEFIWGGWGTMHPDAREPGDWSRRRGKLRVVHGDWWADR